MARHTARRATYVVPVVVALSWLVRGPAGAAAAAVGALLVVGNLLLIGAMLSFAIRISLATYQAAALLGFPLRLGLLTGTMLLVVELVDVDRASFGLAAVATYIVLLASEAVAVARGRERELDWTP